MAFAKGTKVDIEKTEQQIKTMLRKAGAKAYATYETGDSASIAFHLHDLNIRMNLTMPSRDAERFTMRRANQSSVMVEQSAAAAEKLWEQACKERWRALHLCVKAKLEAIDAGVETIEDAFLAHVQTSDGETIGARLKPQLRDIIAGNAPLQITGPRP